MEPIALTIPDAAKASGLGRTKVYELINAGLLRSKRVGGRRVVLVSSIKELLGEGADA
jgi:excisionase family DNA binding protein